MDHYFVIREQTTEVVVADEDQKPMFRSVDAFAGVRHVEIPFNDFARQPLLPNQHSQLGPSIAFGDVDGGRRCRMRI